jgi:hypothetical protein
MMMSRFAKEPTLQLPPQPVTNLDTIFVPKPHTNSVPEIELGQELIEIPESIEINKIVT